MYLPVDVQSVELVGAKELEGVVHEAVHAELVFGELLEGLGTERPASEGQHDLKGDGYLLWLLTCCFAFSVSFYFIFVSVWPFSFYLSEPRNSIVFLQQLQNPSTRVHKCLKQYQLFI